MLSVSLTAQNSPGNSDSTSQNNTTPPAKADNTRLVTAVTLGVGGTVLLAGWFSWWSQTGFTGKWTTATEGLWGEDTYAGGSDKMGHLNATYVGTRGMTKILENLRVQHTNATWLAAGTVFLIANGVEFADAFSPYGFAIEDTIFNSIGIGLGTIAELYPWFDRYFGIRFSYVSSQQYLNSKQADTLFNRYTQLINDYSGMMFLYDFKFAGLRESLGRTFLKYFLVGLNYSTVDYQPSGLDRQRNLGMHIGLNLSDTIKDTWNIEENTVAYLGYIVTKYLAFPLTNVGLLYDLNSDRVHFHVGMASRLTVSF